MPPQVVHVRNASKVAAALANEKCQKILDYLQKHEDATETSLSKALAIPLSTVHYNMKILVEAQLVLDDEYTYSAKGKEVTHYRVNKNPIVIVQEESQLDSLKALVPAAILAVGVGIAYSLATKTAVVQTMGAETVAADSAVMIADESARAFAAPKMAETAAYAPSVIPQDMLPFFLAGVVITLTITIALLFAYRWWNQRMP